MKFLIFFLIPLLPLVYLVLFIRNLLYDKNVIKSYKPLSKCVSIGNLKAGGTGKTPFSNMLIEALKKNNTVAYLSRGYGRQTEGYILASTSSTSYQIGDESKMICQYHPDISVAVCEKRAVGIDALRRDLSAVDIIILDDAMQHRSVTPAVNILLTEYDNPYYNDFIYPFGNLRDIRHSAKRADIVVVTKCPSDLSLEHMNYIAYKMKKLKNTSIYFSTYDSMSPVPLFSIDKKPLEEGSKVIVMSGIASPRKFIYQLSERYEIIQKISFEDHHIYSEREIESITNYAIKHNAFIVVTPKDKVKLEEMLSITAPQREVIYVQDIQYRILNYNGRDLNSLVNEIKQKKVFNLNN